MASNDDKRENAMRVRRSALKQQDDDVEIELISVSV